MKELFFFFFYISSRWAVQIPKKCLRVCTTVMQCPLTLLLDHSDAFTGLHCGPQTHDMAGCRWRRQLYFMPWSLCLNVDVSWQQLGPTLNVYADIQKPSVLINTTVKAIFRTLFWINEKFISSVGYSVLDSLKWFDSSITNVLLLMIHHFPL